MSSSTFTRSLVRSASSSNKQKCISSISINRIPLTSQINCRSMTKSELTQNIQKRSFFSLPDITKLVNLVPGTQSNGNSIEVTSDSGVISGIEVDGEEQRFHARKILPYSQIQLYSLVSNVPSYSSFIPFCNSSNVLLKSSSGQTKSKDLNWKPGKEPFEVLAELSVGFGGLEERYISKVVGIPFESVTATASSQTPLFKSLITRWSFQSAFQNSPHPSNSLKSIKDSNSNLKEDPNIGPTLLTIDLNFNFANPLHRIASQAVLPKVADKMIQAFEKRCLEVYGKGIQ
ncbi:uncharacterized protein I206_107723 [Kwoniella pini CBS 10737]|uniref:Coenzyme Q-binding protein COQ10 START domain-containing protein n=1 Tax=Kwoniella pini CBS 10737 TaxID=1296096 RepID=A0A1B9HY33_9TREE|nr:uncharacterized protein I206_06057 [Kwoniella pini CBS 10737]OCF48189.1 hypothetical protein I206_06057 [Kwoniella pini CBS 10737]